MSAAFDSHEIELFARVIDRASIDLRAFSDSERSILAIRVLNCAQDGERAFGTLLDCAKGTRVFLAIRRGDARSA